MARPTDPAKLAAYLARQAANSRAYRARKAAEKTGKPVAPEFKQKAPARYRPPTVSGPIERAFEAKSEAAARRREILRQLPSARNPEVRLRIAPADDRALPAGPIKRETKERRAQALRDSAKAQKLQSVGKAQKQRLLEAWTDGPAAWAVQTKAEGGHLTPQQRARFIAASERIASKSQQTLAILFGYDHGAGQYSAVIERIVYPNDLDIEAAIVDMETLAGYADTAEQLYGPRAIKQRFGGTGRLRV